MLNTKRLEIVPINIKYLNQIHKYTSDSENTKNMLFLPNKSLQETKTFIEDAMKQWQKSNQRIFEFVILLNNDVVGSISLDILEDNISGEFGWIIDKDYHKMGIGYEAALAIKDFGINKLNLKRFIAHCDSENIGSKSLMEKLGMVLIKKTPGRKNRDGGEDRIELEYEILV